MKNTSEYCLLIDIGNTNTHVALSIGKKIYGHREFPTDSDILISLRHFLKKRLVIFAVIASVVPKRNKAFLEAFKEIGISNTHFVNAQSPLSIGIKYPKPQTIGADRLVNAEGAVCLYGSPAIVIDFGTAVTFDIINGKREYIGGVIAPGLAAMTDYLYQKTALLPKISLKEPKTIIGKSTTAAMTIGAVIGYRGLINEILGNILMEKNMQKAFIISTGGYSHLISKKIPQIKFINNLLTIEGLNIIKNDLLK